MGNLREITDDLPMRGAEVSSVRRTAGAMPMARAAAGFKVDPTGPIGQKWTEAGGAAKVGAPTSGTRSALSGQLQYQSFEKGAILFTEAFGAVLFDSVLFAKWAELGSTLQGQLGAPIADAKSVFFGRGGSVRIAMFQRGAIAARGTAAFEVHGRIYERWRALNDVRGLLGWPTSDEETMEGGGRRSRFARGDMYWKGSTNITAEVHGPIRDKWEALGGAAGLLGYPVADEASVMAGSLAVGRFSRFENGVIYWSSGTGAHEVHGAIRDEWENAWGGATGPLGFPTSDESSTPTSGGRFSNFEHGCLVWHPGSSPFAGVHAFTRLELFMDRFQAKGRDGGIADQDLYVKVDVKASSGETLQRRYPDRGTMGTGREVDEVWLSIPRVQSDLVVDVRLEGWDSDENPLRSRRPAGPRPGSPLGRQSLGSAGKDHRVARRLHGRVPDAQPDAVRRPRLPPPAVLALREFPDRRAVLRPVRPDLPRCEPRRVRSSSTRSITLTTTRSSRASPAAATASACAWNWCTPRSGGRPSPSRSPASGPTATSRPCPATRR